MLSPRQTGLQKADNNMFDIVCRKHILTSGRACIVIGVDDIMEELNQLVTSCDLIFPSDKDASNAQDGKFRRKSGLALKFSAKNIKGRLIAN